MGAMHFVFVLISSLIAFSDVEAYNADILAVLNAAGCTTFASLIVKTNVVEAYETVEADGLTIFAPSNSAFTPPILAALKKLKPNQVVALLKYHAVAKYLPFKKLKANKGLIPTLAIEGDRKYTLKAKSSGKRITLLAGEDSVRINRTLIDLIDKQVIYLINDVLLPSEIFGKSDLNVTAALEEAGCSTFASLIIKTHVIDDYLAAEMKGVTIFAPYDTAFASPAIKAALKKLTPDQVVALLKYHAVGDYLPTRKLRATNGHPVSTLAADGDDGKYTLKAVADFADGITLIAEENVSLVVETVVDSNPLVIFKIKNVLLPSEIFRKSPALAGLPRNELV